MRLAGYSLRLGLLPIAVMSSLYQSQGTVAFHEQEQSQHNMIRTHPSLQYSGQLDQCTHNYVLYLYLAWVVDLDRGFPLLWACHRAELHLLEGRLESMD